MYAAEYFGKAYNRSKIEKIRYFSLLAFSGISTVSGMGFSLFYLNIIPCHGS
jgi:hypothetical protein